MLGVVIMRLGFHSRRGLVLDFDAQPHLARRRFHQMRQLQNSTAEIPNVLLVSMTVAPAHDTPPVLAEYASHFRQDPSRWFFLTGDIDKLNDLGVHAFKLNSVDGSLTHSTRFVVVDRQRRIRGFYTYGEDAFMRNMLHDVRQLEQEPR